MKRRFVFLSSLLVPVLALVLGIGWAYSRNTVKTKAASSQTKLPPQHIMYGWMFRHVVWLNGKAEALEKEGKDASLYRDHYKKHAQLSQEQADLLNQVAQETIDKVKQIDDTAMPLILELRKKVSSAPPTLSPELVELEAQRTAAINEGHDKLRASFGADWERLDTFVKEVVSPNIQNLSGPAAFGSSQEPNPEFLNKVRRIN
ncbi:MAG: hypothetical protein J2P41_00505 [Blastocatellia bacterium]|nr:hypothetical protein [Blastocatellia bacterium]